MEAAEGVLVALHVGVHADLLCPLAEDRDETVLVEIGKRLR